MDVEILYKEYCNKVEIQKEFIRKSTNEIADLYFVLYEKAEEVLDEKIKLISTPIKPINIEGKWGMKLHEIGKDYCVWILNGVKKTGKQSVETIHNLSLSEKMKLIKLLTEVCG